MSASILAPQQHKQPSRKGKKAWRKNVDLTEVTTGLEEVREETVRTGGPVSSLPSSSLFALDTTGSDDIRLRHKVSKPLKADEIIAARSAVPAVDSRKRKEPYPTARTTDGIVPSSKRRRGDGISYKELQRLKELAYASANKASDHIVKEQDLDFDPWADEVEVRDERFSFLEKKKPVKEPGTLKHAPISLSASGKPIAAVKTPEAGKSYNPLFSDWDALLDREGAKEVEAEKKRSADQHVEQERAERAAAAAAEMEKERNEESEWESEWEGIQSEHEEEDAESLRKKRPERKTKAERNKIARRKEAERRQKWEEKQKAKERQAGKVKELAKQAEEKERAKAAQALVLADEDSDDGELENALRRKQFGKIPIPDAPLELVLPDELQDSLRLLKPEGNLLKDRFRSMMVRGKIEARRPITQPKKRKVTVTQKWSYKDWKLKV